MKTIHISHADLAVVQAELEQMYIMPETGLYQLREAIHEHFESDNPTSDMTLNISHRDLSHRAQPPDHIIEDGLYDDQPRPPIGELYKEHSKEGFDPHDPSTYRLAP